MRFFKIVIGLQAQPESFTGSEDASQPHRGSGTDTPFGQYDLIDTARWHPSCARERVLANAHRSQEFFQQHFAGVDIRRFS